jgi:hypothetical protein
MDPLALLEGYKKILTTIYSPREYCRRVMDFLASHEPLRQHRAPLRFTQVRALSRSMLLLGVVGSGRLYYWKLFFWSLFRRPRQFPTAITLAIYGFHFRKIVQQYFSVAVRGHSIGCASSAFVPRGS